MDDKQKSKKYFDGHSSTFVNRNGYWNYDYRLIRTNRGLQYLQENDHKT